MSRNNLYNSDFIIRIQTQVHSVVKMKNINNLSAHTNIDELRDAVRSTSLKAPHVNFHQDVFIRAHFEIFPSVKELFPTTAL